MVKLMIFDLDGTLLYTLADLAAATNYVLKKHGFSTHRVEDYRYFIGNGLKMQIARALPPEKRDDIALIDQLATEELDYYNTHITEKTCAYDGIPEALAELQARGIKLAVVTNKPDVAAQALVKRMLLDIDFFEIWGKRDDVPLKPDPMGVLMVMQHAGVLADETLYFGDSGVDMQTAVNAGVEGIGVLWGYRDAAELTAAGAARLLANPMQLTGLV